MTEISYTIENPHVPAVFDIELSAEAKTNILAYMEGRHASFIIPAREIAIKLARRNGTVVSDDITAMTDKLGLYPRHHNARGPVCLCPELQWTGRVRPSSIPNHHRNLQKVWELA